MSPTVQPVPLSEQFCQALHLTRDLSEHLEHAFLPAVKELKACTRQSVFEGKGDRVTDFAVRNLALKLLERERYFTTLEERAEMLYASIAGQMEGILRGR